MKKYLAMILALVMALSLVACGDKKDDSADNSDGDTASGRVYWLNFKPEADEAKTCPQCGAPVSDDALFCNKCGAQL